MTISNLERLIGIIVFSAIFVNGGGFVSRPIDVFSNYGRNFSSIADWQSLSSSSSADRSADRTSSRRKRQAHSPRPNRSSSSSSADRSPAHSPKPKTEIHITNQAKSQNVAGEKAIMKLCYAFIIRFLYIDLLEYHAAGIVTFGAYAKRHEVESKKGTPALKFILELLTDLTKDLDSESITETVPVNDGIDVKAHFPQLFQLTKEFFFGVISDTLYPGKCFSGEIQHSGDNFSVNGGLEVGATIYGVHETGFREIHHSHRNRITQTVKPTLALAPSGAGMCISTPAVPVMPSTGVSGKTLSSVPAIAPTICSPLNTMTELERRHLERMQQEIQQQKEIGQKNQSERVEGQTTIDGRNYVEGGSKSSSTPSKGTKGPGCGKTTSVCSSSSQKTKPPMEKLVGQMKEPDYQQSIQRALQQRIEKLKRRDSLSTVGGGRHTVRVPSNGNTTRTQQTTAKEGNNTLPVMPSRRIVTRSSGLSLYGERLANKIAENFAVVAARCHNANPTMDIDLLDGVYSDTQPLYGISMTELSVLSEEILTYIENIKKGIVLHDQPCWEDKPLLNVTAKLLKKSKCVYPHLEEEKQLIMREIILIMQQL